MVSIRGSSFFLPKKLEPRIEFFEEKLKPRMVNYSIHHSSLNFSVKAYFCAGAGAGAGA